MMRAVLAGLGVAVITAPVISAPVMAAPKQKAAHPPATIEIHNQRNVVLNAFVLTKQDDGKTIAKLAKPIPAGEKAKIQLSKAKGCAYLARWEFEDAGDEAQVDLCHDPKIILTD
jgi:hypothetical protein